MGRHHAGVAGGKGDGPWLGEEQGMETEVGDAGVHVDGTEAEAEAGRLH